LHRYSDPEWISLWTLVHRSRGNLELGVAFRFFSFVLLEIHCENAAEIRKDRCKKIKNQYAKPIFIHKKHSEQGYFEVIDDEKRGGLAAKCPDDSLESSI
jgi:hypothetical protein